MKIKVFTLFSLGLSALFLASCAAFNRDPTPEPAAPVAEPVKVREPVVALVLGGGGVKGFAHVGVIKVLESQGIKPQIVVGTSAGSFVGALYASGMSAFELQRAALNMTENDIRDLTLSSKGFLIGEKLQQFVNVQVKNKPIQAFPLRYAAVATDLASGEKVVFNYGNTGQAVRASCSIPNVFLPTQIGNRQYVDGGLVSPVPVNTARDMGADVVIAVDISARPKKGVGNMGWWGLLDQSINILSQQAIKAELARADVVIQPSVQHADALNLDQRHEFLLEGERVAQGMVPQIQQAIASSRQRLAAQAVGMAKP
ncbi:patatin-like phospholipase family protein [Limnobacter humi]|uniref:Patatin-like phospholipase family protein n=1 Tax=Limnobacter humi TaxID=1778671 RepID=A0ABT1WDK2_9BURK|nr:patatin-like phospholipase family protein [Limnobacter humi]MCQ8895602.1 patatin-like phospholipase family protein [Limnobacter humi]